MVSLPSELWLRVIEEMPPTSVPHFYAVSHLFRRLSREIRFSQFAIAYTSADDPQAQPPEKAALAARALRRKLDRLTFWSSDSIAPCVRRCHISLRGTALGVGSRMPLVSACFEAIARFRNLRELRCGDMLWLEAPVLPMRALTHLTRLQIDGPLVAGFGGGSPITIAIEEFNYTALPYLRTGGFPFSFLAMLDPTRLRCLTLRPDLRNELFGGADAAVMALFTKLHTLDLVVEKADFNQLHAWISPFPAIRHLTLDIRLQCHETIVPATPLAPHLRTFTGSSCVLPLVLQRNTPHNLTIRAGHGSLLDLLFQLLSCDRASCSSITSLELSLQSYDLSTEPVRTLSSVLALFPHLVSLTLHIHLCRLVSQLDARAQIGTGHLCDRLPEVLGALPRLETATVNWWPEGARVIPDIMALKSALLASVPSLKYAICALR
ncbi:hypothetical protein GGX14DRAFT_398432 [Mycena pura]|uniref:F-box domain-containing protein n=1 Tax=Mycena pura TaxID=153505 RepID=A0AAD6VA74_9AGAR|nr:hypothetical protein GGX14DRAFT_398432 [Mycena pura]